MATYDSERLRFAPSPTGDLHVGGARAALFNWLYARKTGGRFLLRIEDTDAERSSEAALESILESLRWLGMDWDEDIVYQSRRGAIHREAVEKLLNSGAAYRCFCTKEELEADRERAVREKLDYHYSGRCSALGEEEIDRRLGEGAPFTVRFRVSGGRTAWTDLVHGDTSFDNGEFGDFIIAREDGSPVYLLGVAVDDADMGITLVMRGDDHISNTPRQVMLMQALGSGIPRFAHLPQVLGEDKKKLSKRHGAASVTEYRRMGFLPEAVVNFLALLGWNPGDDREKMSVDELIEAFSIENISKKSSVFDMKKLEWLNGRYLHELPPETILNLVGPTFVLAGYVTEAELDGKRDYLLGVVALLRERCRLTTEFAGQASWFFEDPREYDEKGMKKHFKNVDAAERLEKLAGRFEALDDFTEETTEEATRALSEELEVGAGKLIHPTRLAVTGTTRGPGLFELLTLIGRERVIERMRKAAAFIRAESE